MSGSSSLPAIPVVDVGSAGANAIHEAFPEAALRLLDAGRRTHSTTFLRIADPLSRRWVFRTEAPYAEEIRTVARSIRKPGVWALNMSFEWGCTTGVGPDEVGRPRMVRILDWCMEGLGQNLVVAQQKGPAGGFYNLTWPGFVGVISGVAPGRFAIAINQAPMRRRGLPRLADWALNRMKVNASRGMPPPLLVRRIFEEAKDFETAERMLRETELCVPVIFTISGVKPGEGRVIERTETEAWSTDIPVAVANDWIECPIGGTVRGSENSERRRDLNALMSAPTHDVDGLTTPVINQGTRMVFVADAATGRMTVAGYESDGRATDILALNT